MAMTVLRKAALNDLPICECAAAARAKMHVSSRFVDNLSRVNHGYDFAVY